MITVERGLEQTPLISEPEPRPFEDVQPTPRIDESAAEEVSETAAPSLQVGFGQVSPLASSRCTWSQSHSSRLPDIVANLAFEMLLYQVIARKDEAIDYSSDKVPRSAANRALIAVDDLVGWLQTTEGDIAELAGFSRRSISNWRAGTGVYPKTVRSLLEIHALVGGLVRSLGTRKTLEWLNTQEDGESRYHMLESSEGRRKFQRIASSILFERKEPSLTVDEADEVSEVEFAAPTDFGRFSPPKSRRRNRK